MAFSGLEGNMHGFITKLPIDHIQYVMLLTKISLVVLSASSVAAGQRGQTSEDMPANNCGPLSSVTQETPRPPICLVSSNFKSPTDT